MRNTIIGGMVGLVAGVIIGSTVLTPQSNAPRPDSPPSGPAPAQDFVIIGTGGVTGVYYPTGGAICLLVNKGRKDHGVRCSVESSGGSVYNLNTIRSGEMDIGVVQSDWQFHAYKGTSRFADQDRDADDDAPGLPRGSVS